MKQTNYSTKYKNDNGSFDELYPDDIAALSTRHWSPIHVAQTVAEFLAESSPCRVLDIGSGVGKFCLTAAMCKPEAYFFGVELRPDLVRHARKLKEKLDVKNALFIEGDFIRLNLSRFDHIYFYNSFFEHLDEENSIDKQIPLSVSLYEYYTTILYNALKAMPAGTRVATYHTFGEEIPREYTWIDTLEDGMLNFWIKQ